MTIYDVKAAFVAGREARTTNLHSTGTALWSYEWWEVARWVDGVIVERSGPSYSPTTTRHRNLAMAAHRAGIPLAGAIDQTPTGEGYMRYTAVVGPGASL